jgi:Family of unknown function (DUF6732)
MKHLPALAAFLFVSANATPVFAHFGHVGELAGHSHWIGLGAAGIAASIGVAVALIGEKTGKKTATDDGAEDGQETTGEDVAVEAGS